MHWIVPSGSRFTKRAIALGFGLALLCAFVLWPVDEPLDPELVATVRARAARTSPSALAKALPLVDPYDTLRPFLSTTHDSLRLLGARGAPLIDVRLGGTPASARPRSLAGMRIVLDPGHMGGAWSKTEQRHFTINGGPVVREGDLTYATARILMDFLVRAGADVVLTRGAPKHQPFPNEVPAEYDPRAQAERWIRAHPDAWPLPGPLSSSWLLRALTTIRTRDELLAREPFELFNRYDLERRAKLAASADLFLSLHYNTTQDPGQNGVMVFVPGAFAPDELQTDADRATALKHALSDTLATSVALGRRIGLAMQERMLLPVLGDPEAFAVQRVTIDAEAGVFARNLAVLRHADVPALLLEGPCMNQPEEHARLLKHQVWVDGAPYPERVLEYAEAVFSALAGE